MTTTPRTSQVEEARRRRAHAPARTALVSPEEAIRQLPWNRQTAEAFLAQHDLIQTVDIAGEAHQLVLWGRVLEIFERTSKPAQGMAVRRATR